MYLPSIILNTLDRYDMTVRCIGGALANADHPFEFLACDNASGDPGVVPYLQSLRPAYLRVNPTNEGCAKGHNQMLLRAKGDLIVLLDNDIELRPGWLRALVDTYAAVQALGMKSGVLGIHTINLCPEQHAAMTVDGVTIHPAIPPKEDAVFGTRMFDRAVLEKVGYFCEDYGPYGLCDNEFNSRVHHSGFTNYYINFPSGNHLDLDVGQQTPYRKMKDESMRLAGPVMVANMHRYMQTQNFYVPQPELR